MTHPGSRTPGITSATTANAQHGIQLAYAKAATEVMQAQRAPSSGVVVVGNQQPQQSQNFSTVTHAAAGAAQLNSLWMGELDSWMDDTFLYNLFAHTGELVNVKVIRDKQTGTPAGYGFIYFSSHLAAKRVLENFNGQPIPGSNRSFKLNWAQHGLTKRSLESSSSSSTPQHHPQSLQSSLQSNSQSSKNMENDSIFVGDLAPDVTDFHLLQTFQYYYPSAYFARVVTDQYTRQSKGYGFVHFREESERVLALSQMQGFYIGYRPIKVNVAVKKTQPLPPSPPPHPFRSNVPTQILHHSQARTHLPQSQKGQIHAPAHQYPSLPGDTTSSRTVFIGGIDVGITHEVLRNTFSPYGTIVSIKIPVGKGCGFVEFSTHEEAGRAISELGGEGGGSVIGGYQVRLSWGRPSSNRPPPPIISAGGVPPGGGGAPPSVSEGDGIVNSNVVGNSVGTAASSPSSHSSSHSSPSSPTSPPSSSGSTIGSSLVVGSGIVVASTSPTQPAVTQIITSQNNPALNPQASPLVDGQLPSSPRQQDEDPEDDEHIASMQPLSDNVEIQSPMEDDEQNQMDIDDHSEHCENENDAPGENLGVDNDLALAELDDENDIGADDDFHEPQNDEHGSPPAKKRKK